MGLNPNTVFWMDFFDINVKIVMFAGKRPKLNEEEARDGSLKNYQLTRNTIYLLKFSKLVDVSR